MLDARAALGEGPDWDEERQREGGAVRFAPDGRLDAVVEPPVGLVIPSRRPQEPHACGLFRARPGFRGSPQHAFAG